jgi:hypothetical protein
MTRTTINLSAPLHRCAMLFFAALASISPSAEKPEANIVVIPLKPVEMDPAHRTCASYGDVGYDQKLRPQFHFPTSPNRSTGV